MKLSKFLLIALPAAFFVGCSPKIAPIIETNPANIDQTLIKTTPIKEEDLKRWSHLDIVKDTIPGMSVDRAYGLLKGKKGTKTIVAVIDSGIDVDHEDLKGKIWVNPKEIPGNNKDDDNNGYVDDINGWNFLGKSHDENLELTRIVKKGDVNDPDYAAAKAELDSKLAQMNQMKPQVDMIAKADKDVRTFLKKEKYTLTDIKSITTTDEALLESKNIMFQIATQAGEGFQDEIKSYIDYVYDQLNFNLNVNFDGRKVVGDNPNNFNDKKYGDGNVKGPDVTKGDHGTHVAGIIAQIRGNKKGGDGVTDNNIQIMAIRAVPNGDEYDKDIALAIRYAADNGAKVINGSFGKDFSPNREWVFEAIKYAESKDVLFVHAAGNDAKNIDVEPSYPNDSRDKVTEIADNVLTIGALAPSTGPKMVASFSNYAKKNVDVFAPGVQIYATFPNNNYSFQEGTSMAGPNAAGVAALIRAYYPNLKASQVKRIVMDSGTPINYNVIIGEERKSTPFSETCVSGKIVNAYNALIMAEKMSKKQ